MPKRGERFSDRKRYRTRRTLGRMGKPPPSSIEVYTRPVQLFKIQDFYDRIMRWCDRQGTSLVELSEACGWSQPYVTQLIRSKRIEAQALIKLSHAMGVGSEMWTGEYSVEQELADLRAQANAQIRADIDGARRVAEELFGDAV